MIEREPEERLPLPSEDEGDLVDAPPPGETDDYLVAQEEGVPYVPPTERVLSEPRPDEGGPDVAGVAPNDDEELRREAPPDDPGQDLGERAAEALRRSDVPAGDRLRVGAIGSTIYLRGEVESVEIADELIGLLGDIPGVEDVIDETTLAGMRQAEPGGG
jgi:hypothetical protein